MINPSDQRGGADLWLWLSNLGFVKKSPRVFRPANGSRSIILLRDQLGVHCDVIKEAENNIVFLLEHPSAPFFLASPLLFKLRTKAFFEGKCTYVWIKRFFRPQMGAFCTRNRVFFWINSRKNCGKTNVVLLSFRRNTMNNDYCLTKCSEHRFVNDISSRNLFHSIPWWISYFGLATAVHDQCFQLK